MIIFLIPRRSHMLTPRLNRLETVQMRGHIICFYAELTKCIPNQLMQLCTARTAWSKSDQAVHRCNSRRLGLLWSDSVIKLVSVLFGKCTTLVVTKF